MSADSVDSSRGVEEPTELHASAGGGIRWKRWLFWIALAALGAVAVGYFRGDGKDSTVQYKTEAVRRGDIVVTVAATGNLEPTNQVEVGSEQSGIVKSVEVDANDHVKVGQVLATLDTTRLDAQILQAKASLASAKAQVLSAQATVVEQRKNFDRTAEVQRIGGGTVLSKQEVDTAQASLDRALADKIRANAAVNQAQAVLEASETDLSKTVIRSPIDGVVLTRSVDPGQTVAASLQSPTLFLLAEDLAKMSLNVAVDEADVSSVAAGQEATFTVDAYPGRRFPARIRRVSYGSVTTDGVVTYETVLDVDNTDLSLRPGMTATATITTKKIENAILVPNAALRFTPPPQEKAASSGGSLVSKILPRPPRGPAKTKTETNGAKKQLVVWTLKDGQLVSIPVTLGSSDGTMTEIVEGEVEPGMELAVDIAKATK
ncbi:efflux RND transporter periplasmic adaptor subunit [Candidatus Sumerlaeota bacterium]|nr:efflux RND transporter periplasmic adaptor subunit [Candidatus Sumerlaeota bacterium]